MKYKRIMNSNLNYISGYNPDYLYIKKNKQKMKTDINPLFERYKNHSLDTLSHLIANFADTKGISVNEFKELLKQYSRRELIIIITHYLEKQSESVLKKLRDEELPF